MIIPVPVLRSEPDEGMKPPPLEPSAQNLSDPERPEAPFSVYYPNALLLKSDVPLMR